MNHRIIELPSETDSRGALTYIESRSTIPFNIKRVYYLYEFSGERRGEHAHKELEQVIVALGGGLDVTLDDGETRTVIRLDNPTKGLYIPPGLWRELENFESKMVCLVLASKYHDEKDYIRDYQEFLQWCDK